MKDSEKGGLTIIDNISKISKLEVKIADLESSNGKSYIFKTLTKHDVKFTDVTAKLSELEKS